MRFHHLPLLALGIAGAAAAQAQALPDTPDDTVVVTGTRSLDGVPATLTGSSVTQISAEQLQSRQTRIVSDVLRDVPGLAVSRSGAVGGSTQVRIRGTEANHTLVLIDGIEASDPFLGEFDFSTLIADDVARLEVLRGQQSAIYGSDAIGGVIHYITATGREAPGFSARAEGGSFGTLSSAARLGGVSGDFDYAVSAAYNGTDGTPSARRGIGNRALDADNAALSGKFGYALAPNFRLSAVGRYSRLSADTNPQDFDFTSPSYGFVVDGTSDLASRAIYGLVRAELDLLNDRWSHALTAQVNDNHRNSRTGGVKDSDNRGQRLKASYDTTFRFDTASLAHGVTLAADFEREKFRSLPVFGGAGLANAERRTDNIGLVAQYDLRLGDRAAFGASVRHDDNDRFEDATTYRVRGNFQLVGGLSLRAAAGSGIKAPTNYELFGFDPASFVGNPDLKPERSEGWEVGGDLRLAANRVNLGLTYFDNVLRDEIYTVFSPSFVASPANRASRSKQHGVEASAAVRLLAGFNLDLAYTWLDAEENGAREVRRPEHSGSANLGWRDAADRFGANLTVRYNGTMRDSNFTNLPLPPVVRLDPFTLVNFAADVAVAPQLKLFGRVENILDEEYEEVFTYRSPGRAFSVGLRATL